MKQKLLFLSVILLLFVTDLKAQIANHVVISEVYGGGGNSGSFYKNDFIELYNPTQTTVDLTNWSVQYASAAGGSWNKTNLTGSIGPGQYYLIQQAPGSAGSESLPTPDAIGTIALSGTAGKIALCNSNATLAGVAPPMTNVVDLVGFGGAANFYEGTGPTVAPSNTTSVQRNSGVGQLVSGSGNGYDSNNNAADFTAAAPKPQNSASPRELASSPAITPAPSSLDFGNVFVNNTSSTKAIRLSFANLSATDLSVSVGSPFFVSKSAGGPFVTSFQLTAAERASGSYEIFVRTNVTTAGSVSNNITLSHADFASPVTVGLSVNGVDRLGTITKIHAIQGSGDIAIAGNFQIEAVVTGVYETLSPAGFYIQEEDSDADADPNTSEGIFVATEETNIKVGDIVRVAGASQENGSSPSFNQAVIVKPAIEVISSGNPAPSFAIIDNADYSLAVAERYEGMLVKFASPLTISDVSRVAQYGELSLSMDGSIYVPTQIVDPNDDPANGTTSTGIGNVPAVDAYASSNTDKTLILDDGSGLSNPTVTPYLDPLLNTVRVNGTIEALKGIMGFAFNKFRIQPLVGFDAPVISVTRPAVPTFTKADIKIASFNVLNYFNGNGDGSGFPTSRGASTSAAFSVQRSKIIKALSQMNADVVGLIEIENDGVGPLSAVQDLVNGLNAELGQPGAYAIVDDGTNMQTGNTDLIKCAIIYKPAAVAPSGTVQITGLADQRPFLAQTFETVVSPAARTKAAEKFTFIVNHFKSKSGTGTGSDADQKDGQGNFNETRRVQADALVNFIDQLKTSGGTDRIISVGDYNAYFEEDPMDILRASGLILPSTATDYSYHFSGTLGSLDHAVVSSTMNPMVSVKKWNINSTEPSFLQYNNAKTDASSPFRSSDHDPILIGVNFSAVLPVRLVSFDARKLNQQVELLWKTASETDNSHFTVQRSSDASKFEDIAVLDGKGNSNNLHPYRFVDTNPLKGISYYRLKQTDFDGTSTNSTIIAVKMGGDSDVEFSVYPNPVINQIDLKLNGKATTSSSFKYKLLNADGRSLVEGEGSVQDINKQINAKLPALKSGMYIIKMNGGKDQYAFKFLKQ